MRYTNDAACRKKDELKCLLRLRVEQCINYLMSGGVAAVATVDKTVFGVRYNDATSLGKLSPREKLRLPNVLLEEDYNEFVKSTLENSLRTSWSIVTPCGTRFIALSLGFKVLVFSCETPKCVIPNVGSFASQCKSPIREAIKYVMQELCEQFVEEDSMGRLCDLSVRPNCRMSSNFDTFYEHYDRTYGIHKQKHIVTSVDWPDYILMWSHWLGLCKKELTSNKNLEQILEQVWLSKDRYSVAPYKIMKWYTAALIQIKGRSYEPG